MQLAYSDFGCVDKGLKGVWRVPFGFGPSLTGLQTKWVESKKVQP